MADKFKITFLGTGDAIPSANRNHSGFLVSYRDENLLFDCGEGIQRQFRKARLNPCKLTKILISHWHGDHILGIPGILQTLALSGYNKFLEIYGPKGTKKFMKEIFNTFVFTGKIKFKIHEVEEGKFFENNDFYLESKKMQHGCPCNAYNFVIKGRVRIDKKKLEKLKISPGPHIKELKEGKDIFVCKKKYKSKDLVFVEDSKKLSIVMDTKNNVGIVGFVKDADLLIIESTYDKDSLDLAKEHWHMTCVEDADIAKKAKVKMLALTHISQRYSKNPKKLLDEAKKIFKNTILPKDLDVVEL